MDSVLKKKRRCPGILTFVDNSARGTKGCNHTGGGDDRQSASFLLQLYIMKERISLNLKIQWDIPRWHYQQFIASYNCHRRYCHERVQQ